LDDVNEFSYADSDSRAEAKLASQTWFRCIPGSYGEREEFSDECVDLVSCKISVISTSDTMTYNLRKIQQQIIFYSFYSILSLYIISHILPLPRNAFSVIC